MRLLLIGLGILSVNGLFSAPAEIRTLCEDDFGARWPSEIDNDHLKWLANAKPDNSAPLFRIDSQLDVRIVEPETDYLFELRTVVPLLKPIQRFLITIGHQDPTDPLSPSSQGLTTKCRDPGALKSVSDLSEHLSYECGRYLVERSDPAPGVDRVPFIWHSPKCGCTEISAEVLVNQSEIFSKVDDQFMGLTIICCVKAEGQRSSARAAVQPLDHAEILPEAAALVQDALHDVKDAKLIDAKVQTKRNNSEKKKKSKRKGRKFCCNRGAVRRSSGPGGVGKCHRLPSDVRLKALRLYKLDEFQCRKRFQKCCLSKKRSGLSKKNKERPDRPEVDGPLGADAVDPRPDLAPQ